MFEQTFKNIDLSVKSPNKKEEITLRSHLEILTSIKNLIE